MQSVAAQPQTVKPALPVSMSAADGGAAAAGRVRGECWKQLLAEAIRDAGELCRMLGLSEQVAREAAAAQADFPLLVPRGFVARMRPGDPCDPLLRQVLPVADEQRPQPGFGPDPLDEQARLTAPALVQKYAGRALLLAAGGCAVNCRYCFRRSFPYGESGVHQAGLAEAVAAIAADPSIDEVLLSGGDPLLLDDDRLNRLVEQFEAIPQLSRLRIHSRLPIVLPERVTGRLVEILSTSRLTPVVVVHANHASELDASVASGMRRLAAAGVLLFNQSVLLAGVNDSADSLAALSLRLLDCRVIPYYLHLLDRVQGAAHFEVDERKAVGLHEALKRQLPGYAVPKLVREIPGSLSKTWIGGGGLSPSVPEAGF
jgi:EF-P beta-lysylation protein EpmB